MRLRNVVNSGGGLLLAVLVSFSSAANANQVFSTTGTAANGSVSASADFTVSTNSIMVTLMNLLVVGNNQTVLNGISQLLSEISFSVAGTPVLPFSGAPTDGNAGGTGTAVNVASDGTVTTGGTLNPWSYGLNTNGTGTFAVPLGQPNPVGFLLSALQANTKSLVSPTLNAGSTFCSGGANNCDGIANGNGQPFYNGSATFTLAFASGVAADALISNVRFGFGTNPSGQSGGEPDLPAVPIPAAAWLFGSGLLGLIGIARRRQAGNATKAAVTA